MMVDLKTLITAGRKKHQRSLTRYAKAYLCCFTFTCRPYSITDCVVCDIFNVFLQQQKISFVTLPIIRLFNVSSFNSRITLDNQVSTVHSNKPIQMIIGMLVLTECLTITYNASM